MCELNMPLYALIFFFLNYMKLVLPFSQMRCAVYTSALCVQRSDQSTKVLMLFTQNTQGCFHCRHYMGFFAILSVINLGITLGDQSPAL